MKNTTNPKIMTAYIAPKGREIDLKTELEGHITAEYGPLFLCETTPKTPVYWTQNIWYDARKIEIESIGDGARKLRDIQRNWVYMPYDHHRRAKLIQDKLPHVSAKRIEFGTLPPESPLGSWCLIDKNTILASPTCAAPVPNGMYEFIEDKDTPPNRAYLKLWEAFTRIGIFPKPGSRAIDVGSSPGGWTWVLQTLGCREVISVDKAELDPKIAKLPKITFLQESAFGLNPTEIGEMDWLCSDIICYPDRLYKLVNDWIDSGMVKNMICTLKFQSDTDFESIRLFQSIENSRIIHLHHNKHELTWIWRQPE